MKIAGWIAIALSVAILVVFTGIRVGSFVALGRRFEDAFGPSFWLGFAVNLLVAEIWINHTRTPVIRRSVDADRTAVAAGGSFRPAGRRG